MRGREGTGVLGVRRGPGRVLSSGSDPAPAREGHVRARGFRKFLLRGSDRPRGCPGLPFWDSDGHKSALQPGTPTPLWC